MKPHMKGIVLAAGGAGLWGGSGVAGQYLMQSCGVDAAWLTDLRLLLGGLILLAVDARQHGSGGIFAVWCRRRNAVELLVFAVFGMLAVQYSYLASIAYGNAPATTVIQYTMPAFVIIWTALSSWRLPQRLEVICVIMAMAGTFVLVTHGSLETLSVPLLSVIWGFVSALAAALYTILPRRLIREWRSSLVVGWGMLVGGLLFLPAAQPWSIPGTWDWLTFGNFAYVIVLGTAAAFSFYLGSLRYLTSAEAGILGCLEPLSSIVFSVACLGTSFGLLDIVGTLLVVTPVFLLAKR